MIQRQRNAYISGENIHTKQLFYELPADIFFQPMKRLRRRHFSLTFARKQPYNLLPIAKYRHFTDRENATGASKKNFRARRLFTGCDVTFRWMILTKKMCQASYSVLPRL